MDRKAVDSVNAMEEKNRYLPGLRAWVGYRNKVVYYDRQDRLAGDGKLSFLSRIQYAMDAITSFSYKPLRLSFALFFVATSASALLALSMLFCTSTMIAIGLGMAASVFFVGGLLLLCIGVLGEYLGRVYDEVRSRPLAIISTVHRSADVAPHHLIPAIATQTNGHFEHANSHWDHQREFGTSQQSLGSGRQQTVDQPNGHMNKDAIEAA
jgi:hypothetical protein